MSKFVSKYFYNIFTILESYKSGKYELALTETFYLLDNILKMPNVDIFLSSLKSYYDSQSDFNFEFLKFSTFQNEVFKVLPIIAPKDNSPQYFNKNVSNEAADQVREEFEMNKDRKISSEACHGDSTSYDELSNKDSFQITSYEIKDELVKDSVFSFGGLIVEEGYKVEKGLTAYTIGTTANIVYMKDNYCYVANVGDSMAVLYKGGKAYRLNVEHKLTVNKERERINNSGSTVKKGRIGGRLNLTRALGDFIHKANPNLTYDKQAVICLPEVTKFKISNDMEFIIMGCDGIWDCVEIQKFCEYISRKLKEKIPISLILKEMFSIMISKNVETKVGSDNMTCLLIELNH